MVAVSSVSALINHVKAEVAGLVGPMERSTPPNPTNTIAVTSTNNDDFKAGNFVDKTKSTL